MMDLTDLRAFVRISDLMSVSAAARALGLPKSRVSRALSRLEQQVGAVLLERSTRHMRLTDAGTLFRPHALRILADVDEAGAALDGLSGMPSGTLRISLPFTIATALVAPMLPQFMAAFPQVRVVLTIDDRVIDMPAEVVDMVIRVGPLTDSDLIAKRLLTSQTWLCASSDYFAARGIPLCAADLRTHALIDYTDRPVVYYDNTGGVAEFSPTLMISDAAAMLPSVLGSAGIARLPDFLAKSHVHDGRLVRLWPDGPTHQVVIHALYASHRALSAKVRVFIEALAKAAKTNANN
ncbi:LysR family transcriptional regulator [Sphingomonas qomolangmaensis]|uniref:LysR family transcriptional regulator n=1 Tax=Sphingomonas qomolangmaensis TaxID=2918765 RepID=A0ABY5LCG1_9SPHN|nr:LysR family transcriptional regulator [Sphingomonas qomolangmaensis]UUL83796.1 LysR family transcriptional regulator [Sphingomonas qomolangmaensis]